eukprot:TRINITY_DN632_c0_g1_i1.p1 TRINITY_DN632_c0_g1~~TRINITY_DN632_c0_g1_i1.p1  ORF type:complete len:149 (-),score=29.44 TRINITY_DN632_c0_g1_i1:28-474(-)
MSGVLIKTFDGDEIQVDRKIFNMFEKLRQHNVDPDHPIVLHSISADVLNKVVEYCAGHSSKRMKSDITAWNLNFIASNEHMVHLLTLAAFQLGIPGLLDLTRQRLCHIVDNYEIDDIVTTLGIDNDFTEKEKQEAMDNYFLSLSDSTH